MFVMIRIGFSGLPVAFAGHAAVHRPHSVHAYPSRSCRHEGCSTRFTPNVSDVSRSTVFRAPFGVRSMRNVFTIAKMMWMCFECGTYARKENKRTTWVHHNVRHHSAASNLKIEVLAIADEIGFHSGRATVPAAASAALNRRNEMTIPRMKQSTIVASRIPSCMSFFGRITYRRWRTIPTRIAARTPMTSSARYSGPVSENPAIVGVGTRHPGAYTWAVISTTLAPRMTNAQKMNEWSTPAYHSRATFRWKIPYTTKFFTRVGRWSHRGSFRCAVKRYRRRRYIFRPKIERETARKTVTAIVSRAVNTMRSRGTRVPFSTRGCCEDDQLAVVCRYGLPLPSAPDADHPPTRLAENRNEVLRREEEELHRRLGAVLQVLADAFVKFPFQSQHARRRFERTELVLFQRADRVERGGARSGCEEIAVQGVQDEPAVGTHVGCEATQESDIVRPRPTTECVVQAEDRVESGARHQAGQRVPGHGHEVEAVGGRNGGPLLLCRDGPLVLVDRGGNEFRLGQPPRAPTR